MGILYTISQQPARVLFSAFFRMRAFGREHVPLKGPVLIVSNHQSYLDPVLCGVGLNRELDYMARESLFRNRFFSFYIRALNAFPVRRNHADVRAIKEIIRRLRVGRAVVMFPEATRTTDGRIKTIKSGFELIARRSGATTVPVVIDGAFETWPRHQALPAMGLIYVKFGKPITPDQLKQMGRENFVTEINRRLRQIQSELRLLCGKQLYDYGD